MSDSSSRCNLLHAPNLGVSITESRPKGLSPRRSKTIVQILRDFPGAPVSKGTVTLVAVATKECRCRKAKPRCCLP
jgi:hypothetical protein